MNCLANHAVRQIKRIRQAQRSVPHGHSGDQQFSLHAVLEEDPVAVGIPISGLQQLDDPTLAKNAAEHPILWMDRFRWQFGNTRLRGSRRFF